MGSLHQSLLLFFYFGILHNPPFTESVALSFSLSIFLFPTIVSYTHTNIQRFVLEKGSWKDSKVLSITV